MDQEEDNKNLNSISFSDFLDFKQLSWASDGIFLAQSINTEVLIRNTKNSMVILKSYKFDTNIDKIEWSLDSNYLAVGSFHYGIIRIYSCEDFNWNCCIQMGNGIDGIGMQNFCWSQNPKKLHLLTTACDYIQITIWSIMDKCVKYIKHLVPIVENKSYTSNGDQLAIAKQNSSGVCFISIYDTNTWKEKLSFECDVKDIKGLKWSPDNSSILVWDSILFSHLYIFSSNGEFLNHFCPDGISLGIHAIDWSPTGQIIAFTNHSNKLRLLNGLSYGLLLEYNFNSDLLSQFPDSIIYTEEMTQRFGNLHYKYTTSPAKNLLQSHFFGLKTIKKPANYIEKYFTKIKFSFDGKYFATWTKDFENKLWIWDISKVTLCSILVQNNHITDFAWSPVENLLCLCTCLQCIYFWSPKNSFIKNIPDEEYFLPIGLNWNQDGDAIIVSSKERFTVCILDK